MNPYYNYLHRWHQLTYRSTYLASVGQAWKAQRGERISQAKRMSSTLAVQVGYPLRSYNSYNTTMDNYGTYTFLIGISTISGNFQLLDSDFVNQGGARYKL